MAGGEAVPASVVARWSPFLPLHNVYGPTETTIGVTFSGPMRRESDADGPVLLGGPIAGISLLVLDARLQPVPFGCWANCMLPARSQPCLFWAEQR